MAEESIWWAKVIQELGEDPVLDVRGAQMAYSGKDATIEDLLWEHALQYSELVRVRVAAVRVLAARAGLLPGEALAKPDPHPTRQRETVGWLREMTDPRATQLLEVIATGQSSERVRVDAARALGRKGQAGSAVLTKLLDDSSTDVRESAIAELRGQGDVAAPSLRAVLDGGEADENVRFEAAALLALSGGAAELEFVASRLARGRGLELLTERGRSGLLALLFACPWAGDDVAVLDVLVSGASLIEDELHASLTRPPEGSDADDWAAAVLSRRDTPRARRESLAALRDPSVHAGVRLLVAVGLGESRCREAVPELEARVNDASEDSGVREAARRALEAIVK
jgi:hypothetical protein